MKSKGKITDKVTRFLGKARLKVKKRSPELLFIGGTVSFGFAIYSAIKAAKKQEEVMADHNERLKTAKDKCELVDEYDIAAHHVHGEEVNVNDSIIIKSEKEINRDVRRAYMTTGKELTKLYSKTAFFSITSLFCFGGAYKVLSGRVTAGLITIEGLRNYISLYEKRNIELNGEFSHEACKYGYTKTGETIKVTDPISGKEVEKEVAKVSYAATNEDGSIDYTSLTLPPNTLIFSEDETREWQGIAYLDRNLLEQAERDAIRIWRTRGWVCENDVRSYLAMQQTVDGQYRCKFYREGNDHGEEPSLGITNPINQDACDGHNGRPWFLELNFTDNLLAVDREEKKKKEKLYKTLEDKRRKEDGV